MSLPKQKKRLSSKSSSTKAKLIAKADKVWQEVIETIWRGRCGWCKKNGPGSGHHIVGKKQNGQIRHEIMNGIRLCTECHRRVHDEAGAEAALLQYIRRQYYGMYEWHMLNRYRPTKVRFEADLRQTIENLKSLKGYK